MHLITPSEHSPERETSSVDSTHSTSTVDPPTQSQLDLSDLTEYTPYLPLHVSSQLYRTTIKHMLDFVGRSNSFSPTTMPRTLAWGEGPLASVACVDGAPVTLTVVGELVALLVSIDRVTQRATFHVELELIRPVDSMRLLEQARSLHATSLTEPDIFVASNDHLPDQQQVTIAFPSSFSEILIVT
ncbi:hypothetical protein C2E23DRAFT_889225 [Lenzites betulinus]|nr:hypothetical protein C2E23DRAFT_889225 [Lenzites betulinus]